MAAESRTTTAAATFIASTLPVTVERIHYARTSKCKSLLYQLSNVTTRYEPPTFRTLRQAASNW